MICKTIHDPILLTRLRNLKNRGRKMQREALVMAGEKLFQPAATFDERQPAEILAVEMQKVKGNEDQPARLPSHCRFQ